MKNFWKWILGIVIVLVVLFGLGIGARLLMGNLLPASVGDVDGFRSPMMGGRGYPGGFPGGHMGFGGGHMLFGGGFMLLGGLLPLALLGLLVYGAFRLGKHRSTPSMPVETAQPVAPVAAGTCPKCGSTLQAGWNHCANCGKRL